jgi:hypothetical protein
MLERERLLRESRLGIHSVSANHCTAAGIKDFVETYEGRWGFELKIPP